MTIEQEQTAVVYATCIASRASTKVPPGRLTDLKATRRYCRHQQRRPEDVPLRVEEGPTQDMAHHDVAAVHAELRSERLRRSFRMPGQ